MVGLADLHILSKAAISMYGPTRRSLMGGIGMPVIIPIPHLCAVVWFSTFLSAGRVEISDPFFPFHPPARFFFFYILVGLHEVESARFPLFSHKHVYRTFTPDALLPRTFSCPWILVFLSKSFRDELLNRTPSPFRRFLTTKVVVV